MNRRNFVKGTGLALAGLGFMDLRAETSNPELGAAVIGYTGHGDYGHSLETIFSNRSGIKILAVADPDEAGRQKTASKLHSLRNYSDFREMLEKEHPQLVSVATRHAALHYEMVLAALKQGAHVYCEKPFTTTSHEADELLRQAKRRGLKIAVAHTMRMMPIIRRLKEQVGAGLIGDLVELRAHGKQDTRAGGEDLMVLGTHLFDLVRMFAGDPEWCSARVLWQGKDIKATDGRRVQDDVGRVAGDEVFAQFAFPKGIQATFVSTAKLRETSGHWGIELHGTKGVARINCDIAPNVFIRQSSAWNSAGKTDTWKPLDQTLAADAPEHNTNPVTDWLDSIAKNREPECSGANGAWAVEMVSAVYQAALSSARIKFPVKVRTQPLQAEQQ